MKTIRKSILLMTGTFVSIFAVAQINLGLQSTTQAALNTAATTAVLSRVSAATTEATKSTVNAAASKTTDLAGKTTAVKASGRQATSQVKNDLNSTTDINTSADASSSQAGASADISLQNKSVVSGNADLKTNGTSVINKANGTATSTTTSAGNKISSSAKMIKNDAQTAINKTGNTEASASGEVKVQSYVQTTKQ